jgi:hypothetical protein
MSRLQPPTPGSQPYPAVRFRECIQNMVTDTEAEESPLGRTKSSHAQLGDTTTSLRRVTVEDLLSMGVPMDVLARTLNGE